ncbi:hypothetical protein SK128_019082 [Halocaridina rubra]|uniref:Uncharacterized protein n=1 Tax=Halocaridina rubra TaxID=373956 RepID=A0AAN8X5N3_HALRR
MGRRFRKPRGANDLDSMRKLWRDRVRENSVVKQFGPRNSVGFATESERMMIHNIIGLLKSPILSRAGTVGVTNLPLVIVTNGSRRPSKDHQEGSEDVQETSRDQATTTENTDASTTADPVRKYVVIPTLSFTIKNPDGTDIIDIDNEELNKESWPDASQLVGKL